MWNKFKKILLVLIVLVLLVSIGFIVLYSFTSVVDRNVLALVNRLAGEKVEVHFDDLSGNLMRQLRLTNVHVVVEGDTLASSPKIQFEYQILDIIRQKYHLTNLDITSPKVGIQLSDAPPDSTSKPLDAFFEFLGASPEIKVSRLGIDDGRFRWSSKDASDEVSDINLQLAVTISDSQIYVQPQSASAVWVSQNLELQDLKFRLNGTKNLIVLQEFSAQVPGAMLTGNGRLKRFPEPNLLLKIDKSRVDASFVNALVDSLPFTTGFVELGGVLEGDIRRFDGRLFAFGEVDSLAITSLEANFERDYGWFKLSNLNLQSSAGNVQGELDLSRRHGIRSDLKMQKLALKKTGFVDLPLVLDGKVNFDSDSWDFTKANGDGVVTLFEPRFREINADKLLASLIVSDGNWKIGDESRVIFSDSAIVRIGGEISADSLSASLTSESFALNPLLTGLGVKGIDGWGSINLDLNGRTANPELSGWVFLDSLLYSSITVYGVDGEVQVDSLFSNPQGSAELELATGFVSNIFLTHGSLSGTFVGSDLLIDSLKFLSKENSIIVGGNVNVTSDSTIINLPRVELLWQNYALKASEPQLLRWARDTLFVEMLNLNNSIAGGTVTGSGFWCFNDSRTIFNTQLLDIPIDPVNDYHYLRYELNGKVDSDIEFYGIIDSLEILAGMELDSLKLVHRDSVIAPQDLGKLQSEILFSANRLGINFLNYEQDENSFLTLNGSVDLTLQGGDTLKEAPLDINMIAERIQLERYRPFLRTNFPLEGTVSGRAELSGTTVLPELNMRIIGRNLRYADYIMPELRMKLTGDTSGVVLDSGFADYIDTDVYFTGRKKIDWDPENVQRIFEDSTFEISAIIQEDSLNFLNSINPELDIVVGDIQARVDLGGTFQNPTVVDAQIQLRNGKLYLARLQNSIDDVELTASLTAPELMTFAVNGNSIRPQKTGNFLKRWFSGIWTSLDRGEAGGEVSARGTVDLTDILRPKVDVAVKANQAYLNYFLENAELIISTENLTIRGKDTLLIAGDVGVGGGVNFDFVESEKNLLLAPTVRETAPFFRYEIEVDLLPGFYIRNEDNFNNFDFQVSGKMGVLLEPRQLLEYRGSLDVEGKYLIQGEVFGIKNGKINFVNPKELPELDIAASKRKSNYTFELKITGALDNPQKDITVIDNNGNALRDMDTKDEMALLLFGVTFNELGSGTDSLLLLKGEELLAQTVLSMLERETRSYTGLDQVRLDGQSSYFESELNKKNTPTLALGKYITPNLYLEYRSALESSGFGNIPRPSLSWEEGNQIYLQYRLNRNWSFSTSYETTQEGNEKVKLDISWRLEF